MTQEQAKKLRKGSRIYYGGSNYDVAVIKPFPHGVMVGIYDEPPSVHVDYLQPENVSLVLPCHACQGGGCKVCGGFGEIVY